MAQTKTCPKCQKFTVSDPPDAIGAAAYEEHVRNCKG